MRLKGDEVSIKILEKRHMRKFKNNYNELDIIRAKPKEHCRNKIIIGDTLTNSCQRINLRLNILKVFMYRLHAIGDIHKLKSNISCISNINFRKMLTKAVLASMRGKGTNNDQ